MLRRRLDRRDRVSPRGFTTLSESLKRPSVRLGAPTACARHWLSQMGRSRSEARPTVEKISNRNQHTPSRPKVARGSAGTLACCETRPRHVYFPVIRTRITASPRVPVSPCPRAPSRAHSAFNDCALPDVNKHAPNLLRAQPAQLSHRDPIQVHLALIHFPKGFH